MDKNKYLERIQYKGQLETTIEVLEALQTHHLLHIPFENLDIHYGNPILLDTEKIYTKLINHQRGGFCYELNGLFFELLKHLGFDVIRISARVFDSKNGNYGAEFDHMAIVATINQEQYLVDVGFGEFTIKPLKLVLNEVQHDPNGAFVIEKTEDGYYRVSKLNGDQKEFNYIFTTTPRAFTEFGGMCTYHQSNPASHFTQKKVISKPTPNGRITLSDDYLKISENGKETTQLPFESEADFNRYLAEYFGIKGHQ
ncbi:arylamine N-acetyltransferase [Limibacter armeniacum]|uniref:arylamine N-acetyltransferase family protein n=1 Tax=Limibacter armeniacum TaxID=466084 RepID=UPI002FE5C16F